MKVLTKADFIAICRKIVAQMAAREQNKKGVPHRVNSFAAFVDDMQPSVTHSSLGATYGDYKAGRFFSRNWEASGANPSSMAFEYPGLIIEETGSYTDSINSDRIYLQLNIIALDRNTCENCPPEVLGSESTFENSLYIIRSFIRQLFKHEVFTNGELDFWMTRGEANYHIAQNTYGDLSDLGQWIESIIVPPDRWIFTKWSDGAIGGARGYMTSLNIQVCEQIATRINYKTQPSFVVPVTNCESCG